MSLPFSFFKRLAAVLVFVSLCTAEAAAVPARPTPVRFTQPDGTVITIILRGDERHHIVLTADGYLLGERQGAYYYADIDSEGRTVVSPFMARPEKERTAEERAFLKKIDMDRVLRLKQAEAARQRQSERQ